jgi:hypothetical protein
VYSIASVGPEGGKVPVSTSMRFGTRDPLGNGRMGGGWGGGLIPRGALRGVERSAKQVG